jgi:hypothetical protein
MRDQLTHKSGLETVIVEVHGRLLDRVSFASSEEAEGYKRGVRRWACEKGVIVGIWSHRPFSDIAPGAAQTTASAI